MEVWNKFKYFEGSLIRNYKLDLVNKVTMWLLLPNMFTFVFVSVTFSMKLLTIMYLLPETGAFLQPSVRVFTFLNL